MTVVVRTAMPTEGAVVADIHLAAIASELPYLARAHTDDETRRWFADVVLPEQHVLVAVEDDEVIGFAALAAGHLDHLYVRPDRLRRGTGTALLNAAKAVSPKGLQLFVFQRNDAARAFYRRNGFTVTSFGSGAENEEHEPDLVMAWSPGS